MKPIDERLIDYHDWLEDQINNDCDPDELSGIRAALKRLKEMFDDVTFEMKPEHIF